MTFPPPTERQGRLIWLALTGLSIAVLVGLVAAVVWGLGRVLQILSPVLWPLAVAGVLAYLLDPVVDFMERKGTARPWAIVTVFGFALVLAGAFFGSVVPQIVTETTQLADRIPSYAARLEQRVEDWVSHPPPLLSRLLQRETPAAGTPPPAATNGISSNAVPSPTPAGGLANTNAPSLTPGPLDKESWQAAAGWTATALRKTGAWLFGRVASWFGILAGLALIPVYTFYFLLEKRGISSRWTNYLPVSDSGFKNELVFILNSINNYLIAFFRGQVLVAICDGILYTAGFLIIGLPYAVLIGAAAVVVTMVPFLGAIVICSTALLISVVQFGDWTHPLLVLAVFGAVQALEGLFISPRIMGGRVGLHPVTILIAVMVGTTLLGGLLGGILAIPVTATLRVLMFRYVWGVKPEPLRKD
jgi:predicted PurR-regulated permease PerM